MADEKHTFVVESSKREHAEAYDEASDIYDTYEGLFFPFIIRGSTDERNFVKKSVNWALRQIGKRNADLNKKAVDVAKQIQALDSKSARWVAADALKELQSPAVQKKVAKQKAK